MRATHCPGREELEAFAFGSLLGSDFARVAEHVERCPRCEGALGTFDRTTEPFLARLRRSVAADVPEEEPMPAELIASARSALSGRAAAGPAPGEAPRRLGRFELLERLGAGSFGDGFTRPARPTTARPT
jgi:anti-sigma factor RsiW